MTPEQAMQRHIQEAANLQLPTPDNQQAERFCPISLGDWLELCRETAVPHVPAEKVTTLLREDCLSFDTQGEHQERLKAAFEEIQAAKKQFHMMRFDCCAGLEIKHQMAQGQPFWKPEFNDIIIDDPRAFDILLEYPREEIPIWRRPWVSPIVFDNYPVEYRAFVNNGELKGISSYYPQRPLIEFKGHLETVRQYTELLAEAAPTPFLWPLAHMPGFIKKESVHFTADFMATAEGILFLEGGPPHQMGAHPCCFIPGNTEGIALTDRNETPVH